ncbi:MAG: HAMP domain-containing protein [Candidatus Tectomicrobia bacterium]|nr:HAMP domain-containing protein [Candidatus Tectomicrobia bacterium]
MFRWTIAQKIFWGYVAVILLAVGLSLYAILSFQALNDLSASILRTDLEFITQVKHLRDDFLAQVRNEKQYLVTKDPDFLAQARGKGAEVRVRTRMLLDRVLPKRLKEPLSFFADQHKGYEAALEQLAAAGKGPAGGGGKVIPPDIETRLDGYFTAMRGHLDELLAAAQAQAWQRTAESDALARRASKVLLGLCVAAGVAALLIAAGMTRHIGRPLKELREGTFRVARGDFDHPVSVSGEDELAHFARCFNQMAERLHSLDQTKAEFFSAISHELRTPLTSVREALQLLLDGIPGPLAEGQKQLLSIAREGNDKILRLINDLLKLAKLEADMMRLNLSLWRMEALVEAAAEEIRPIALQASIRLHTEVEEGLPSMRMDGVKIQAVLANLLSNAVKFTPPEGSVRIRASLRDAGNGGPGGRAVRVSVSDTGIGIDEKDLERIFDKFYRARGAESRQGVGLGLPIAKRIVEAHGGRIWAESGKDLGDGGPGSTVTFEIPVRGAAGPENGHALRGGPAKAAEENPEAEVGGRSSPV